MFEHLSSARNLKWFYGCIIFYIANSVSRILALSSHSVRCPSVVRCPQASHPTLSPLYDHLDHTNQVFSESLWHALSIHPTPLTQSPNTNTQMHKYTNTASVKLAHNHICYIFEKVMVQGPQILIFPPIFVLIFSPTFVLIFPPIFHRFFHQFFHWFFHRFSHLFFHQFFHLFCLCKLFNNFYTNFPTDFPPIFHQSSNIFLCLFLHPLLHRFFHRFLHQFFHQFCSNFFSNFFHRFCLWFFHSFFHWFFHQFSS